MLTSVLMGDEPLFQTYIKGLHRIQARQPIRHAVAMSVEDMRSLIRLFPSWEEKTVLRLAWMTASRWSDIQYLTTDHFVELHPLLVLDWWTAPKSSKLVPDRPYRYHRFPGKFAADLRKLIAQLGPGSRLTNISMARLTRAMRMLGTRRDHLQQKILHCPQHEARRPATGRKIGKRSRHGPAYGRAARKAQRLRRHSSDDDQVSGALLGFLEHYRQADGPTSRFIH
eukprot:gene9520-biopygen6732